MYTKKIGVEVFEEFRNVVLEENRVLFYKIILSFLLTKSLKCR